MHQFERLALVVLEMLQDPARHLRAAVAERDPVEIVLDDRCLLRAGLHHGRDWRGRIADCNSRLCRRCGWGRGRRLRRRLRRSGGRRRGRCGLRVDLRAIKVAAEQDGDKDDHHRN